MIKANYLFLSGLLLATAAAVVPARAGFDVNSWIPLDHPAIQYYKQPLNDPITRLQKKLDSGEVKLEYTPGMGYLPDLLKKLGINQDTQMLVFSKTSFQAAKIGPKAPRAIFFNDEVAIGNVQTGEVYEVASLDPKWGVIFYTFDVAKTDRPMFDRRDVCVQCHQGPATEGVPGILISSVYPSGDGTPAFREGFVATDARTPIEERWGGWYVTGNSGEQRHRGNAIAPDPTKPGILDMRNTQNLMSLEGRYSGKYLQGTSDIVALITYEHQARMTDLMTRLGWETQAAIYEKKIDQQKERDRLSEGVEELLRYMLFSGEATIREPITGSSTFSKTFPERGPRDSKGRSLRDFDLNTRLFKYPLSYMIYSEAWDGLPDYARNRLYQRLYEVLTGADRSEPFKKLSAADRKAILEILRETKKGLPDYYRNSAAVETGAQ